MRFTFLTGMPYTFYADTSGGETRYTIGLYKGKKDGKVDEEVIEVTPETWDRLLRAQQVEHLNTVAVALDGDHKVGNGEIGTIASRLNEIADHVTGANDEIVFDASSKNDDEVEPS